MQSSKHSIACAGPAGGYDAWQIRAGCTALLTLLHYFFGLCLMRRTPQELPPSLPLLTALIVAGLALGMPLSRDYFGNWSSAIGASLLETVVTLVLYAVPLWLAGHPGRYLQTVTALFGVGLLVTLVLLLLRLLAAFVGDPNSLVLPQLVLVGWAHAAFGHVWRHALGISLFLGIGLALGFTVLLYLVVGSVFPLPAS